MPRTQRALTLTLLVAMQIVQAAPLLAQGPVLTGPVPLDRRPFNDDIVCQSGSLARFEPTALKIMKGVYEFESLMLSESEEAEGDLWAQFNYPKRLFVPGFIGGLKSLSFDELQERAFFFNLTIDKKKLTMSNFLLFTADIPDKPYELQSLGFCVGWRDRGFYFRATTGWDGGLETNDNMIKIAIPGPPSGVGLPIILTAFCLPFTNCWESATPGMAPSMIVGRGVPVAHWGATDPGEAMAATDRIYNRSRWAPDGGTGDGMPTDGDGTDAFPFTTYDIEAVGGVRAEIDTRMVEVCQQGACVRQLTEVFVLRRVVDGTIRRRFYNDPRLGFTDHYPGGQEFQAFFTAGDPLQLVSGRADPTCLDLTETCFLKAEPTPEFIAGLFAIRELCGSFNPCGTRWGRPKEPINAEVVIEGTDDSLRLAQWCTIHQGAVCNDSTTNPLDGRDVLVKEDSLGRMEAEARQNRARPGYITIDTAGARRTLSGDRGLNAPRAQSEAERLCRVRATQDSLAFVNGPIPETEDRRLRRFNADSAFASCRAEQDASRARPPGGTPGRP